MTNFDGLFEALTDGLSAEDLKASFEASLEKAIQQKKEEDARKAEEARLKLEAEARKKAEEERRKKAAEARLTELRTKLEKYYQDQEKKNKEIIKRNKARSALNAIQNYLTEAFGVAFPEVTVDSTDIDEFIAGVDNFWQEGGKQIMANLSIKEDSAPKPTKNEKSQTWEFIMDADHPSGELTFKDNLSDEKFTINNWVADLSEFDDPIEKFLNENGLK